MTYTINGKEYTEFDINKRCADLIGEKYNTSDQYVMVADNATSVETGCYEEMEYNPCSNWADAGTIIDKCWDEFIEVVDCMGHEITNDDIGWCKWSYLMAQHNCTKLVAACICYIEINETAL
jgi:hypothetical protein